MNDVIPRDGERIDAEPSALVQWLRWRTRYLFLRRRLRKELETL